MKVKYPQNCRYYPFDGQTLRSREVAGFVLAESVYEPGLNVPRHVHEENGYLSLVLQGGYTEYSNSSPRILDRATVIFHPPGESHSNRFHDGKTRLFNIWFSSCWLDRICAPTRMLNSPAFFNGGVLIQSALKLYQEFCHMDAVSSLVIEGLMLEMLGVASRSSQNDSRLLVPRWLEEVKDIIHARFNEHLLVSNIAESISVHPVHLSRVFRRQFHCTIGEYVRRLRVEFACHKLSTSQTPLAEIALAAGFSDQGHFSRTFKRFTGLTPGHYRSAFPRC